MSPGAHDKIDGLSQVDKVISVDQSPIGNTPSSNPATYTGLFDLVRELFAKLPESKVRGYSPGRFSFNLPGGRCEACEGDGQKRIEMHFLPDVWVTCEACHGTRYTAETLAVQFRGKTIADVLGLTVDAALDHFASVPKIRRVLQTLHDVGLGYVALGQAAPTLSGGEAQRVKLATELSRPDTGRTLYVLDEPTTGLHMDDVRKLLAVVHRLADLGNTVVIIEHNLDVIKTADWVIDLGPEAGDEGGRIVAEGTPEAVARVAESLTGAFLRPILAAGPLEARPVFDPKAAARAALEETKKASGAIEELTERARMPWQADGRKWHTRDRVGLYGLAISWDGRILERVVDRIEELGGFDAVDWSHRTFVRAGKPGLVPFLEANTGEEWVVTLRFRVPKNSIKAAALQKALALTPFNLADPPVPTSADRLVVATLKGSPFQEIILTGHALADFETPAFDAFLAEAVAAYAKAEGTGPDAWAGSKAALRLVADVMAAPKRRTRGGPS